MWFIILILMAIAIGLVFSHLEKSSVVKSVINSRDGPSWKCEMPFFPENLINLMKMKNFFQPQIKYVGKNTMIISKKFIEHKECLKLALGNNLKGVNRSYSFSKC